MEMTKERMLEIAEILYSRDFCFGDSCCKHCEKVQAVDSRDVICFYNRVIDLLQADADGRLVVLPCKVGDTLYHIFYGEIIDTKVRTFFIGHPSYNVEKRNLRMIRTDRWDIPMDSIGKTVFLTRKEAEAALEKMGGGEK